MTQMNYTMSAALLTVALAAPLSAAQSRSLALNAPAATDLRPAALVAAPAMPLANEHREPVAFSWATDDTPAATAVPEPFEAHSRQFHRTLDAAALAAGVSISTDGAGAIIRLSSGARGVALDPGQLSLTFANGRQLSGRAASDQLVDGDDLRAAGMAAPSGSLGLRLAPELGSGTLVLRYAGRLPDDAPVMLWVFDRNSDTVLSARSMAGQFLDASGARARVTLEIAGTSDADYTLSGTARAPDGTRYALEIDGDGQARFADRAAVEAQPGLWEWQFQARTGTGIERNVKTAFALGVPVARFDDSVLVSAQRATLTVTVGIEVASGGRYEASATLLATDRGGRQVPVMVGAVADWLAVGSGALTMQFDAAALKARGVQAPFRLRDLTLRDQSRLMVLERRADALSF